MIITVLGDSFATNIQHSWVNLLAKHHDVRCVSQPGCSEYKIYRQCDQVHTRSNLVIVSHTSWSRIPVQDHPVHTTGYHKDCDLIFSDCEANNIDTATEFFKNHFWEDFWRETYCVYRNKITETLHDHNVLHLDFFDHKLGTEYQRLDFSTMYQHNTGDICHMTSLGNQIVAEQIGRFLDGQ